MSGPPEGFYTRPTVSEHEHHHEGREQRAPSALESRVSALEALLAEKEAGPRRLLRGLRAVGRGVLRPDLNVLDGDTTVGVTTSGTFSPTLKVGIALALIDVDAGVDDGQHVTVDVRGRGVECEVVRPPFVDPKTR